MREAAAKAHVAKSTLQNRINKFKADPKASTRRVGRAPDVNEAEENPIFEWIQEFGETGYPFTRLMQLKSVSGDE